MIPQILDRIRQAGIDIRELTQEQAERIMRSLSPQFAGRLAYMQAAPSDNVFYSNAAHALAGIRQDRATGSQWLAMLTKAGGIKVGEDTWTGLSEWLRASADRKLHREEIKRFMAENAVYVKENIFIDERDVNFTEHPLQLEMNEYIAEAEEEIDSLYPDDHYRYAFNRMIDEHGEDFDLAFGHYDGKLYITSSTVAREFLGQNIINDTRLEYTTFGLDDRKEIALYVPDIEQWNVEDDLHFGGVGNGRCIGWIRFGTLLEGHPYTPLQWQARVDAQPGADQWQKSEFNSSYVPQIWTPPVLHPLYPKAHISRVGDRYHVWDVAGMMTTRFPSLEQAVESYNRYITPREQVNRILVIDEIQSKRHQQGRKLGYLTRGLTNEYDACLNRCSQTDTRYYSRLRELKKQNGVYGELSEDLEMQWRLDDPQLHKAYMQRMDAARQRRQFETDNEGELRRLNNDAGIPAAPFERNWHELCMKRMFRYAAENGFDRIVWTSGEVQAKRYDIGQTLDKLYVERQDDGRWTVKGQRSENWHGDIETFKSDVTDAELPRVVGSKYAQEAIASSGLRIENEPIHIFGSGMKSFYDNMLPQFVSSYGKRWGIRITETNISQEGEDVMYQGIDITPQMKQSVMQGQPMFMTGENGKVLGFTVGDRIRIMPGSMTAETLVHEYTHVWATAMRYGNPEGWQSIKELLADSPLRTELLQQAAYRHLHHDEDLLTAEVLAHLSGRNGAERLKAMHWHGDDHLMQRVMQALQRFWSWVAEHMLDIKRFDSISEVTDRILYDLASGTRLEVGEPAAQITDTQAHTRISHITTYHGKGNTLFIRCKIDGQQQMGIPVSPQDCEAAKDRNQLPELAQRYFAEALVEQDQSRNLKR